MKSMRFTYSIDKARIIFEIKINTKGKKKEKKINTKICVRKHLTEGFLCAVLDLSGILCFLLIPEYSGIKRRGKPVPEAEESRHFPH